MRIKPGTVQELPVIAIEERVYLIGDENQPIILPKRDAGKKLDINDMVTVFTFYNEDRQIEATSKIPEIQVGGVGSFRIKNSNALGVFIDIGIKRDILIPNREQREMLEEGRWALVTLQNDERNARLFGSTRLTAHLRNLDADYQRGDEVELIIAERLEIGRRVIINGKHIGVLFRQEMISNVREGERVKGYIRKQEGKDITVSMTKEGEELIKEAIDRLLEYLQANKGYVRLNDDSDPEEIKLRLRMSKKTFKKAVGHLYKERKIELSRFGIKLASTEKEEEKKPVRRKRMD